MNQTLLDEYGDPVECLDSGRPDSPCQGEVDYRYPLSGTGRSFPRCDRHWDLRLQKQEEINERYPTLVPGDFDPLYAGEAWDED